MAWTNREATQAVIPWTDTVYWTSRTNPLALVVTLAEEKQMSTVEAESFSGLTELAKQAALGEEIVLIVDGEPIAQIVPFKRSKPREFGSGAGMIVISADFDEPLDDFKDYE